MIYKSEPYAFYGKSTDTTKPTPEEFPSLFDDNLVLFYELDTGNIKYYDIESETWATYPVSDGGNSSSSSSGLSPGNNNTNLSDSELAVSDLMETGLIDPPTDSDGAVYTDNNDTVYI